MKLRIVTYNMKRRCVTQKLDLPKKVTLLMNDCFFQIYKLFKMNHRLLLLLVYTKSIVFNIENLSVEEDNSLDFKEHDRR